MGLKAMVVPVTPFSQNCSIIWCEETMEAAAVDPGGDLARINEAIGNSGAKLTKILITHGHLDHAGGADELSKQHGVPIEGPHKGDDYWIEGIPEHAAKYGWDGGARSFSPDRWLEGGDTCTVGNVTLDVYHCPGHTPGHVVFVDPKDKVAFVGDVLFKGSIGRTDFPGGDFDTLITSITTNLWPRGNDITFVSGHGPLSTFGEERHTNPFVSDQALAGK